MKREDMEAFIRTAIMGRNGRDPAHVMVEINLTVMARDATREGYTLGLILPGTAKHCSDGKPVAWDFFLADEVLQASARDADEDRLLGLILEPLQTKILRSIADASAAPRCPTL